MTDQHLAAKETSRIPRMRVFVVVWLGLLLIVAVEVALTYAQLPVGTLLAALLVLALLEAGLAVMYFMHLKYERRILFWSLIPAILFVLFMLNQVWWDAVRLRSMRP
jgi:cytochrome c oxidase subunit IV